MADEKPQPDPAPALPTAPSPPTPDPLDVARDALARDAATRGARCRALIDAALKEQRCDLVARLVHSDGGQGGITIRGVVELVPA